MIWGITFQRSRIDTRHIVMYRAHGVFDFNIRRKYWRGIFAKHHTKFPENHKHTQFTVGRFQQRVHAFALRKSHIIMSYVNWSTQMVKWYSTLLVMRWISPFVWSSVRSIIPVMGKKLEFYGVRWCCIFRRCGGVGLSLSSSDFMLLPCRRNYFRIEMSCFPVFYVRIYWFQERSCEWSISWRNRTWNHQTIQNVKSDVISRCWLIAICYVTTNNCTKME